MKNSSYLKSSVYLFFLTVFPYFLTKVLTIEKSLTAITLFYILIIFYTYNKLGNNLESYLIKKLSIFNKIYLLIYILLFIVFILISQNYFLNIEVITWDVPSYLVGSQEIKQGNLPFETQWESKGPLLTYLYFLFSELAGHSYIHFRVLSDLLLVFAAIVIFKYSLKTTNSKFTSSIAALTFSAIVSMRWYVSEYSEYFSLIFIAIAFYLFSFTNFINKKYFIVGLLISTASLINQASIFFLLPYIFYIFFKEKNVKHFLVLLTGSIIPHLVFFIIYSLNGLVDIYLANYYFIPLGYSTDINESSFYELRVWLREFYNYNKLVYFSIIGIFFGYFKNNFSLNLEKFKYDLLLFHILTSLLIYFIGSHNYAHHLIYFIFFFPLLITKINSFTYQLTIALLIFIGSSSIFVKSFESSYSNITNMKEVQENYPMNKLANQISGYFTEKNYSVFALDYLIILYYLEKPNYSYIVHPTNHFEDYITDVLEKTNRIKFDNVNYLLSQQPQVIICSPERIHKGKSFKNDEFSCLLEDYKNNYILLDTEIYRIDPRLEFYWDPYKSINVFIKEK